MVKQYILSALNYVIHVVLTLAEHLLCVPGMAPSM